MYFHQSDISLYPSKRYDYSGDLIIYAGHASPGAGEDEEKWAIQKFEYDPNGNVIAIKFPFGSASYVFKWTERDTYSYS